jgi:hypothetical protein
MTQRITLDVPALYLDVPMMTSFVAALEDGIALPASSAAGGLAVAWPELSASRRAC